MNKLKLACLTSLLISSISYANPSCNGFQIKLKNNLADDLLVTGIKLNGAKIDPGFLEQLRSKTAQVFTINNSVKEIPMSGEFTLHTISLPTKTVTIQYTLENKLGFCEHSDHSPTSDYPIDKTRKIGEVEYSINS